MSRLRTDCGFCGRPTGRAARLRALLRRLRGERGFTLMELLAAGLIMIVVGAPITAVLTSAAILQRLAQEQTGADQLAAAQIEDIRGTTYDQIGITDGNPPGNFASLVATSVGNVPVHLHTQISYVDDPAPRPFVTHADYKRIVVTVTRDADGKQLAQKSTNVSQLGAAPSSGSDQATIQAQVVDAVLNQPVPNVAVTLGTGPSATRNDTTDTTGTVTFPALTPNPTSGPQAYYDLTAALAGYTTYPDDVPPGAAAQTQVAAGQTWNTVIRVFKAGTTLNLTLLRSDSTLYTGTATVTVGASWGGQTFTFTGGSLTVTQLNGQPLIPGENYTVAAQTPPGNYANAVTSLVPTSYPNSMAANVNLTLSAATYATRTLTVMVQTLSGAGVGNARVQVSGGPAGTYFYGTTNASGQVGFDVPSGTTPYSISVASASGSGSGTATVNTSSVTTTVTVQ